MVCLSILSLLVAAPAPTECLGLWNPRYRSWHSHEGNGIELLKPEGTRALHATASLDSFFVENHRHQGDRQAAVPLSTDIWPCSGFSATPSSTTELGSSELTPASRLPFQAPGNHLAKKLDAAGDEHGNSNRGKESRRDTRLTRTRSHPVLPSAASSSFAERLSPWSAAFAEYGSAWAATEKEEPGESGNPLAFLGPPAYSPVHDPFRLPEASASTSASPHGDLRIVSALPLCRIPPYALGPMVGAGSFSMVYPVLQHDCPAAAKLLPGRKLGVKIFRLRLTGVSTLLNSVCERRRNQIDSDAFDAFHSYFRRLPFMSRDFHSMIRMLDEGLTVQRVMTYAHHLTPQLVLTDAKALREVINTNCFYKEMIQLGMIFRRIKEYLRKHRPNAWATLQEADTETQALAYAEIGLKEQGWALPVARVIVSDHQGIPAWGLLTELFEGDLKPEADRTGSTLDGWLRATPGNDALHQLFSSRESLMDLTSKTLKSLASMHTLFGFGHFDIKPNNLLYRTLPTGEGRPTGVEVALADFGMASEFYDWMPVQGTIEYMPPEMKGVRSPVRARPAFDVYAAGLTISRFWSSAMALGVAEPWVSNCIVPALSRSEIPVEFTFRRFTTRSGPRIYTAATIASLAACFAPAGKVEKTYHTQMPHILRLLISQMVEADARVRVSMRHAALTVVGMREIEQLSGLFPSRSGAESNDDNLQKFQDSPLIKFLLFYLGIPRLSVTTDNMDAYGRLGRYLLDLVKHEPLHAAATELVQPLDLDYFRQDIDWINTTIDISESEVEAVISRTRERLTKSLVITDEAWADLVDILFGVTREGLRVLAQRAIYVRKTHALQQAVGNAVGEFIMSLYQADGSLQLIAEDPYTDLSETILDGLRVFVPKDTEIGLYLTHRVAATYTAWTTLDRLLRKAVQQARSHRATEEAGAAAVEGPSAEARLPKDEGALQDAVFSSLQAITAPLYFGLPWGFDAASTYGRTAEEMTSFVQETYIPHVSRMWPQGTHRAILRLTIDRTVRKLNSALPASPGEIYKTVFGALPKHGLIPTLFHVGLEREEYTQLLYGKSLKDFKKIVVHFAAQQELRLAVERAVAALSPEDGRDARDEQTRAGKGFIEVMLRFNGKRMPPKGSEAARHKIIKKTVFVDSTLTVGQVNTFFTKLLADSFDTSCREYVAELKVWVSGDSAEFQTVPENELVSQIFAAPEREKVFKVVATHPSTDLAVAETTKEIEQWQQHAAAPDANMFLFGEA
ncbi:hypothetical protein BESB_024190 [Besnoitia besnoiti]|uniref:Protein kinase domain-containing protein n=1 Tax=Besnoitia besnoiti TaxID=94643 RepID=A0A2A9M8G2_BESBE|nr:hypothetical protein BESB_024190 [Besnoitia besnoiti]PFH31927.1 hypothetical protein BESB_024190 [Besnoitia besnoiti]